MATSASAFEFISRCLHADSLISCDSLVFKFLFLNSNCVPQDSCSRGVFKGSCWHNLLSQQDMSYLPLIQEIVPNMTVTFVKVILFCNSKIVLPNIHICVCAGRFRHPQGVRPGLLAKLVCQLFHPTSSLATACGMQVDVSV